MRHRTLTVSPSTLARVADDTRLAAAARSYIATTIELEGATPSTWQDAVLARDWAWHELLITAGEPCGCDDGTCPSG